MLLGQIMFFINFPTRKYPLKENNVVNDKQKKNDTIVTFSNPICIHAFPIPFNFLQLGISLRNVLLSTRCIISETDLCMRRQSLQIF